VASSDDKLDTIGFRKPPKATQFKKGQSGNPKGRPKGKPNATTAILRAISAKVVITENGHRRTVTKLEAAMMQLVNKAASGNLQALRLAAALTQLAEERIQKETSTTILGRDTDQELLQQLVQRFEITEEKESKDDDCGSERQED
jgi:hemerythrin-like domain-containing protein